MTAPLAYFLTWTTYGSWLHGDFRGWVERGNFEIQPPDPIRQEADKRRMTGPEVLLNDSQRRLVEEIIERHCEIRKWTLHAVNARTNHVHVIVTATIHPDQVMEQFKAWTSRRLSDQLGLPTVNSSNGRMRWWTEHGSTKWINDDDYFHNAVRYVKERQ